MRPLLAASLLASLLSAQARWLEPPKALVDCITAPPPPQVSVSPSARHLALVTREGLPSLATIARPVLGLAGRRFDPKTHGPQRGARGIALALVATADASTREIALPADCDIGAPIWNASGTRLALTNTTADATELLVVDVASASCKRIDGVRLNAVLGAPVRWHQDQARLLCSLVANDGPPPAQLPAPLGPNILESTGAKAPVRTYQDMLKSEHDAQAFTHYAQAQLALVDPASGKVERIGAPAIITSCDASPDGKHLLVTSAEPPFSFRLGVQGFPSRTVVLDLTGKVERLVVARGNLESVPIEGVPTGPRSVRWVTHRDAGLAWIEALDGGDPKRKAPQRDRIMLLDAPFTAEPVVACATEHRCQGITFLESHGAFVTEFEREKRWQRTWLVAGVGETPTLLFDRSSQDAYADPGRPLMRINERGDAQIRVAAGAVWLDGDGASPRGDRPFLDRFELATKKKERLFTSPDDCLERVVALLDDDAGRLLIVRESKTEPPAWLALDRKTGERKVLVRTIDPTAALTQGITKRRVEYARDDGVKLTATLYLPKEHKDGMKWPVFVWAYPREFNEAGTAGQVRGSDQRYTRLAATSPLLLLLAGYAVLDDASMPVVGAPETANDTFVKQIVASAQAAIDHLVALGVAEKDRFAVGGHSYGAFMTANLLAHCDLFRCGVARSGAYNRTLTPFGFQNERRTLWEAPEIYVSLSPFVHAQKINEPLLLIHGEADDNPGTFPIQSQRLFDAVQGNGGKCRLVMLPHEAHGYRSRECVLECVGETVAWLDKYLKEAQ